MGCQQKTDFPGSTIKWHAAVLVILFSVVFLVYSKNLGHGFIFIWDDYKYVVNNPDIRGFTADNVTAVFSKYYIGNYAPLHLMSYMLDYGLWGLDPFGYHFGNILLHALNGYLIYRLLLKLDLLVIPAFFGAAVFVLHPVQVESVAWVAERKNVLSAFFFLLALLAYVDYRKAETRRIRSYVISLVCFLCALLSKSAAVIFPLVICLYDYCFCTENSFARCTDKIPFLLLAAAAAVLAVLSQSSGMSVSMNDYPGGTPLTAFWTMTPVFVSYLKDLVYPYELSPYYMVPVRATADSGFAFSAVMLLLLGGISAMLVRRDRKRLFFIATYVLALLPVVQIVPLLSTMKNDRYMYFPMIGVAGVAALLLFGVMRISPRVRTVAVALSVAVCAGLGTIAYTQTLIWKDNITLWSFAVKQDPGNMLAWLMLAKGYTKQGNAREAVTAMSAYYKLKSRRGPLRGWEGIGA